MSTHHIRATINGTVYEGDVEARLLLVHWIRDVLHLTGTHIGCDTTSCGACTCTPCRRVFTRNMPCSVATAHPVC